ncbi:MAG: hypothetical protein LBF84_00940 [Holosporales bacterium]|jgi:hypothetical protein|nr:hypothetical protein [Holosporales bacterium]
MSFFTSGRKIVENLAIRKRKIQRFFGKYFWSRHFSQDPSAATPAGNNDANETTQKQPNPQAKWKNAFTSAKPFIIKRYVQSVLFLSSGIVILAMSAYLKTQRQSNTIKIKAQYDTLQKIQEEHFAFLQRNENADGALMHLLKSVETTHSLKSITKIMKKEKNIGKIKNKAQKGKNLGESGLSLIPVSFDLDVENDSNVVRFMNLLTEKVPGFIIFKSLKIKRTQPILQKHEFLAVLHKYRNAGKKRMIFSANIRCDVVIPTKYVQEFLG